MAGSEQQALVADGLMTVKEAAEFLRLSPSRLYVLMVGGELAFVKLGRSRRIPRRALVELAARGLRGGSGIGDRPFIARGYNLATDEPLGHVGRIPPLP